MMPRPVKVPSPGEYTKPEDTAQNNGLLSESENPSGDALENALQSRRQKLSQKKIGLSVNPQDQEEQ